MTSNIFMFPYILFSHLTFVLENEKKKWKNSWMNYTETKIMSFNGNGKHFYALSNAHFFMFYCLQFGTGEYTEYTNIFYFFFCFFMLILHFFFSCSFDGPNKPESWIPNKKHFELNKNNNDSNGNDRKRNKHKQFEQTKRKWSETRRDECTVLCINAKLN